MMLSRMQQRLRPRAPVQNNPQMDSYSNHSNSQRSQSQASGSERGGGYNVAMENCVGCDTSCVQAEMKNQDGLFLCNDCYWAKAPPNRKRRSAKTPKKALIRVRGV